MKRIAHSIYSFFVPHEGNNFRARSLHHTFLLLYVILATFFLFSAKVSTSHGSVLGIATDITVKKLYELTNLERQKNNLPPLELNQTLSLAAADKGHDMFSHNYWAHYSPEGASPWDFFRKEGYQYEYAGENLAKNFMVSDNVVTAWMASPGHRENILRPEYTQVGYAVLDGKLEGENTTLVVQFFGTPMGQTTPVAQAPQTETSSPSKEVTTETQVLPAVEAAPAKLHFFSTPLGVVTMFIGFLLIITFLDLYFASRLNVFRFHGKNLAHLIFLAFVLTGFVLFISRGTIL